MSAPTPDELAAMQEAARFQPRPIDTQVQTGHLPGGIGGLAYVVMTLLDATGQRVVFLDADTALVVAENLRTEARAAKRATNGGLIVPPGSLLNGNGAPL